MPELATCLVFTPAEPRLFTLNPSAWLILEMAEGISGAALEAAYLARTAPALPALVARRQFEEGLAMLVRCGMVTRTDGCEAAEENQS